MDKQNVACLFNGVLVNHKKKQNAKTCYNMDEPQGIKRKKPVTKTTYYMI